MEKNFKDIQWKEFPLTSLFADIQRGKRLKKDNHSKGMNPYVSSTAINNGVDAFIGNKDSVRYFKNCLTLANSGSVGACFYQPFGFIASDHVTKLGNSNFNKYTYLFISMAISRLGEKYSFNREINDSRIKKEKVLLPTTEEGNPDYSFMEQYMRKKEQEKLDAYKNYITKRLENLGNIRDVKPLSLKEWKEFKIRDIFENVDKGIYLNQKFIKKGNIPYITAKSENNGINGYIGNSFLFHGNSITIEKVNLSAFYQAHDFYCSHDVSVVNNKSLNKYNGLFICNMINRQGNKYSYGRQAQLNVVKKETVYLPVDKEGNPDYIYMEQYMKNLEFKKLKIYLDKK